MKFVGLIAVVLSVSCSQQISVPELPRQDSDWREFRLPAQASGLDWKRLLEAADKNGELKTLRQLFEFQSEHEQLALGRFFTRQLLNDSGDGLLSFGNRLLEKGDLEKASNWVKTHSEFKDALPIFRKAAGSISPELFTPEAGELFTSFRKTREGRGSEALSLVSQIKQMFLQHPTQIRSTLEVLRSPSTLRALLPVLSVQEGKFAEEIFAILRGLSNEEHKKLNAFLKVLSGSTGKTFSILEKELSLQKSVSSMLADALAEPIDQKSYVSFSKAVLSDLSNAQLFQLSYDEAYSTAYRLIRDNLEEVAVVKDDLSVALVPFLLCERLSSLFANKSWTTSALELGETEIVLKKGPDFPLKEKIKKFGLQSLHEAFEKKYAGQTDVVVYFNPVTGPAEAVVLETLKASEIEKPFISSRETIYSYLISGDLGFGHLDGLTFGEALLFGISVLGDEEFRKLIDLMRTESGLEELETLTGKLLSLFPPETPERAQLQTIFETLVLFPKLIPQSNTADVLTAIRLLTTLLPKSDAPLAFKLLSQMGEMGIFIDSAVNREFVEMSKWIGLLTIQQRENLQSILAKILQEKTSDLAFSIFEERTAEEISNAVKTAFASYRFLNEQDYFPMLHGIFSDPDFEKTFQWFQKGSNEGRLSALISEMISTLEKGTLAEMFSFIGYSADPRLQKIGNLGAEYAKHKSTLELLQSVKRAL